MGGVGTLEGWPPKNAELLLLLLLLFPFELEEVGDKSKGATLALLTPGAVGVPSGVIPETPTEAFVARWEKRSSKGCSFEAGKGRYATTNRTRNSPLHDAGWNSTAL